MTTPTPKPPRAKRLTEPAEDFAAVEPPAQDPQPAQTAGEAVTALLASLDLEPEAVIELQINVQRSRVRIIGADRSLRTRTFGGQA